VLVYRRKYTAVESGINALENNGLDRCYDHGIIGFNRYVALATVTRNVQNLGNIILQREVEKTRNQEKLKSKESA
jgi:IS5 family transposase